MAKRTAEQVIAAAQVREDRYRAKQLAAIKRAISQADFLDHELRALEDIVFLAFGRTKLT